MAVNAIFATSYVSHIGLGHEWDKNRLGQLGHVGQRDIWDTWDIWDSPQCELW